MGMRLLSFAVWALVAASAVFWLTRLASRPVPAPAHTVTAGQSALTASADLSRVLGVTRTNTPAAQAAAEPAAGGRFKLVGLVAARNQPPAAGLALIAVDGKPPKPVALGGVVDGPLVLLGVNHRRVELGPSGGEPTVTLELPAVPEPSRAVRTVPVPIAPPVTTLPVAPQRLPQQIAPQTAPQAGPQSPPQMVAPAVPQFPPQTAPQVAPQTAPPPLPPVPGVQRIAPETR
jgi:general secretion pathway protein C